ncbi:hypothetical protein IPJ70_02440 [Candidatus Campbellbacteria bacterium]|nr:MAG: hypothetical protein IPJ70_02440 [Candidatus Campbellbacteria bacterium]
MSTDVIFDEGPMTSVVLQNHQSPLVSLLIQSGLVKSEAGARLTLFTLGGVCMTLALVIFFKTATEPGITPARDIPPLTRTINAH